MSSARSLKVGPAIMSCWWVSYRAWELKIRLGSYTLSASSFGNKCEHQRVVWAYKLSYSRPGKEQGDV